MRHTGTKLHQQTRKAITKRQPALMTAIRKYNRYCDTLEELAGNSCIPIPRHLSTKLTILRDDPYLMEDVWVDPVSTSPPAWLTNQNVRKGIRAMLKIDRCLEERRRLGIEADNMCAWFGRELSALALAIHSPKSDSLLCEDMRLEDLLTDLMRLDTHIQFQLTQRYADVMRFQYLWQTPFASPLRYDSHITEANLLAAHLSGIPSGDRISLTWLPPSINDFQLLEEVHADIHNPQSPEDSDTDTDDATVDNVDEILFAEALEEEPEELSVDLKITWMIPVCARCMNPVLLLTITLVKPIV